MADNLIAAMVGFVVVAVEYDGHHDQSFRQHCCRNCISRVAE